MDGLRKIISENQIIHGKNVPWFYGNFAKHSVCSDPPERKIQCQYCKCIDMEMKLY